VQPFSSPDHLTGLRRMPFGRLTNRIARAPIRPLT
jgi:hypothetical protein